MTIAVDFDGVLSIGDYEFPNTGKPNEVLFTLLKACKKEGHKLILWSCRENTGIEPGSLDVAVEFCAKYGLTFDAVNDNLEEIKEKYGVNSRKISADKYIDDKAWNPTTSRNITEAMKLTDQLSHSIIGEHRYERAFPTVKGTGDPVTLKEWLESFN
jgi:hypothetical protein